MSFYDDYSRFLAAATADTEAPKRKADWLSTLGTLVGAGVGLTTANPAAGMAAGAAIGGSAGGVAESAVNKEPLNYMDILKLLAAGGGAVAPFNIGFANGGPVPSPEELFNAWYKQRAARLGISSDPDAPEHFYDYRAAYKAGAEPDSTGHWPSDFKREGHPRMIVDGVNTKTGGRVSGFSPEVLQLLDEWQRRQGDPFAGETAVSMAGPAPKAPSLATAKHPGWEALAQVLGSVVGALPEPAEGPGRSRKIGAWAPAISAAITAPGKVAAGRREKVNAVTAETYKAEQEAYRKRIGEAAGDLARWRHAKALKVMDLGKGPGALEGPIPDALRTQLKVPSGVVSYRDMNEWQQAETRRLTGEATTRTKADSKAEDDIIVDGTSSDIASFLMPPELPAGSRAFMLRNRIIVDVNRKLKEQGSPYTYDKLVRLSGQQRAFQQNTANSQRFSQLRQSGVTVLQHLKQWDDLWSRAKEKLKFSNIVPTNEIVFKLAKSGALGGVASAYATALGDVTAPAVAREAAYVLSGGYAPYEMDVEKSHAMVRPWLGAQAHEEQYRALRGLLKARLRAQVDASPYAGGKSNPYLLEPSPLEGWEDEPAKKKAPLGSYEGN